jgi:hypothetical protein
MKMQTRFGIVATAIVVGFVFAIVGCRKGEVRPPEPPASGLTGVTTESPCPYPDLLLDTVPSGQWKEDKCGKNPIKPDWASVKPAREGFDVFIGISDKTATERSAIQRARENASDQITEFSTKVGQIVEQIGKANFKLERGIWDATEAGTRVSNYLSQAIIKGLDCKETFTEKWFKKDTRQEYWNAYGLCVVPSANSEKALATSIKNEQDELRQKIKETENKEAKEQLQNTLEALEKMKAGGVKGLEKE